MAALTKSVGLRSEVRVDDRSYWLTRVASLSASLAIPLVYPRMFALHNLPSKVALSFIHLLGRLGQFFLQHIRHLKLSSPSSWHLDI
jgi:hypothetical protein